jgi:hypothetical protein
MEILFNDLSCEPIAADRYAARVHMAQFILVVRHLTALGAQRTVRMLKHSLQQPLSSDYRIAQWMNDTDVDQVERVFFKTVAAKAPYADDILAEYERENNSLFEFDHAGIPAIGLGVAYLVDSPAISLAGAAHRFPDPTQIRYRAAEGNGNFIEKTVSVCCLTTRDHVVDREPWLRERISRENTISTGLELWGKRSAVWPNLRFCESTRGALEALHGNEQFFEGILRHLHAINRGIVQSDDGPLQLPGVKWSYESGPTMNNPKMAAMRQFVCPDGITRLCEPHTKLIGANLRIHFCPMQTEQIAYIGYVGGHLPTAG